MDIAIAVELLLGVGVDYGSASTYQALVASWRDVRPIPTKAALQAAWDAYVARQASDQTAQDTLKAAIVTTASGAVGKSLTALTATEVRALLALLLYKAGGVSASGVVKPLIEWF